jgi:phospholipase C
MRRRRRQLGLLAAMGVAAFAGALMPTDSTRGTLTATPVEHLVVLMQENHSFDNYFGTYPGADGIPAGVCMPFDPFSSTADCVAPFHFGENDLAFEDPVHNPTIHETQLNRGRMNGFVYALDQRNQDGRLAMGYYDERDVPYYWNLADEFVLFDRFFSSASGRSFANHMYWVAGVPAHERPAPGELNSIVTIFDRLEEAGISWRFYVQNYQPDLTYRTLNEFPNEYAEQVASVPLLNIDRFLDDPWLNRHIVDLEQYYVDVESGTLPTISYMVSTGPSEHPVGRVIAGQRFVRSLIQSLMQSKFWESSAFLVTYDDWGGWYDHVRPPRVDANGYGFRVPALLVGGYARQGHIESTTLDYTSILRFIEDNWGLEPLATRDRNANSIAGAFDFNSPPRPPEFIPIERSAPEARPEPRRMILYASYSVALALGFGVIVLAAALGRRRGPREEPSS